MLDLEEDAVAASWTVVDDRLARWRAGFDDMFALVAGRFAQADSRRRARMYLLYSHVTDVIVESMLAALQRRWELDGGWTWDAHAGQEADAA
ncbi:hypothetical protein L1857_19210 [Amycolatopsis thermalba]|uniref:Uncharacterized protein n=1 Tax=Amycolatopsis thermalba TaxID=944492 RepID=A0ABY4NXI5_9PSEU|nr:MULTISPECIES: hypothetical protein [Amycolatopsis]UQS24794.1 hypothetical protein L1857_19210 [Amycolatopsis thermalba]